MRRPFPRKTAAAIAILILLLLLAWWLLSRKDAPPAEAAKPLAEFGAPAAMTIALCPGLQIITAISQKDGDYESIKTIEAVTDDAVRIRYSSESRVKDIFAADDGQMTRMTVVRSVLKADLENATFYVQRYFGNMPETIPGSTAIGTSTAVLRDLKSEAGAAKLNISNAYSGDPGIDREVRPNIYDYMTYGDLKRTALEPIEVLVDDRLALLPAVKAHAEFIGETAEFVFHDNPDNPLTLAFQTGIRDGHTPDKLDVVKINHPCAPAGNAPTKGPDLTVQLRDVGRVAVYDIHFAFGTGEIRDESQPRLKELVAVMQNNPSWRLRLEGHTDNIGEAAALAELSAKRAETLKAALVALGVDAKRLETAGLGAAHPRESNTTVEGRARNRRIEIQRL